MRVLLVSEYSAFGSGYSSIAAGLIREMERRGHDVLMLAFDYMGQEHPFKCAMIPTDPRYIVRQVQTANIAFAPDVIVVCFDLTLIETLSFLQRVGPPTVGIFPIESDPLTHPSPLTSIIDTMDVALCESRFGTKLLTDAGLRATYFPVGIDLDHWRVPSAVEREQARAQWGVGDQFVVLTVCDNHERKNLPAMMAANAMLRGVSIEWPPDSAADRERWTKEESVAWYKAWHEVLIKKRATPITLDYSGNYWRPPYAGPTVDNAYFIINTKKRPTAVGYDVPRLADRFGIAEHCLILQHEQRGGLDADGLRSLYWAADAYLQLSKAEGLGLPVLEAMACGVPVVAGAWTGMGESVGCRDERGFGIPAEYTYIDPFGNQYRRCADVRRAASALAEIAGWHGPPLAAQAAPLAYAQGFTWERAGDVLESALVEAVKRRKM